MKLRKGQRLPISLPVSIHSKHTAIGNFIVKDISPGGANIHDPDKILSIEDVVYLDFGRNNRRSSNQSSYIKAIVVYRAKRNIGLKWLDAQTNTQRLIHDISNNNAA